jgi:hypothetical protein
MKQRSIVVAAVVDGEVEAVMGWQRLVAGKACFKTKHYSVVKNLFLVVVLRLFVFCFNCMVLALISCHPTTCH